MNNIVKVLESRIDESWLNTENSGEINSIFNSAININFDNKLFTLLIEGSPGVPDSLIIDRNTFSLVKHNAKGDTVRKSYQKIYFYGINKVLFVDNSSIKESCFKSSGGKIDKYNIILFFELLNKYRVVNNKKDGFSKELNAGNIDTSHVISKFCEMILRRNTDAIKQIMQRYCGLGIGLTPSFDDIIIGILSVFFSIKNKWLLEYPFYYNKEIINIINNNTTDISKKYLKCAFRGRFSDPVLNLLDSFYSTNKNIYHLIEAIGRIGGSSGMDILLGIEKTFEYLLGRLEYEI